MRTLLTFAATIAISATVSIEPSQAAVTARADIPAKMNWLDNGKIRLGVNLSIGGAITHISKSGTGRNMINSYDWGRQVQMSFYSGPNPFVPEGATVKPAWRKLGWNPIQSGDCYDYPSKVLEHRNDGESIYVRCIPMIWPLKNTPARCEFECWYRLEGNSVKVRSRILNRRDDKTQYRARNQELPAVYTNGPWYKLVSYLGDQPFTGAEPTVIVDKHDGKGWPWRKFTTHEHWAALLDDNNHGLGIHLPGACAFGGGFADRDKAGKGTGGPVDFATGYMSPRHVDILDANITYEYEYNLIVGSLKEIREHVYRNRPKTRQPVWTFKNDRQNWHYRNATDTGWPIAGHLEVKMGSQNAAAISPLTFWRAEDAPSLYLRAAFQTAAAEATIAFEPFDRVDAKDWDSHGKEKKPARAPAVHVTFPIQGDGKNRTLKIDLTSNAKYRGPMTRLHLLLPETEGTAIIHSIGFQPPERTP